MTKVIRELGPQFLGAPKAAAPDTWIVVNREADARGLAGMYKAVGTQYWQAIAQGHRPGLHWMQKNTPTRPEDTGRE